MICNYTCVSPHARTKLCFSFMLLKILSPYWIINAFCRELQIYSGFGETHCGHLIRLFSHLCHTVYFMATILYFFLLAYDFYGSAVFIFLIVFVRDIKQLWGVMYWLWTVLREYCVSVWLRLPVWSCYWNVLTRFQLGSYIPPPPQCNRGSRIKNACLSILTGRSLHTCTNFSPALV